MFFNDFYRLKKENDFIYIFFYGSVIKSGIRKVGKIK